MHITSEDEVVMEKPKLNKIVRGIVHRQKQELGIIIHDCEVLYTCFQQNKQGVGRWRLTERTGQGQMRSGT